MILFFLHKTNRKKQYIYGLLIVLLASFLCYVLSNYIGYKTVALLLLVTVSLIAMFFDILPVLLCALLSAVIWNFFFIPPKFTFYITSPEDILMFLMYFVIASLNAVLTFKIRQIEKIAQKEKEKEATLKLYNTLLNSLSHELRTPISTIIGATDNLYTNSDKLSQNHKNELITEISKASLKLNRQVENLLNMSRLESGTLHIKKDWCDISELVYNVVDRLKENTKNHPVAIQIKDDLPLFNIDYGLIEEVLYNLIYNAVTYIPKYCLITIRVICKYDHLIITIEDNGQGFPENELANVFDKFYRLKNTKTSGTGLGLSIVKGFVESHNGTIKLENVIKGGAKFTISIPAETSYLNNLKHE